jgi:hypothetical protein
MLSLFLLPLLSIAQNECPKDTLKVDFQSPVTGKRKIVCQIKKDGKFETVAEFNPDEKDNKQIVTAQKTEIKEPVSEDNCEVELRALLNYYKKTFASAQNSKSKSECKTYLSQFVKEWQERNFCGSLTYGESSEAFKQHFQSQLTGPLTEVKGYITDKQSLDFILKRFPAKMNLYLNNECSNKP